MRICILIPSPEFMLSGGMRIRYNRIIAEAGNDFSFEVRVITDVLYASKLTCDVYILCKVFDSDSIVFTHRLRREGKTVGLDIFDDYFSHYGDQRLMRFRDWLRDVAPYTDFAVCGTDRLKTVVGRYLPGVPITVVEDPAGDYQPLLVAEMAAAKVARAHRDGKLAVLWFGIGDNPFFPVGVRDLVSYGAELKRLCSLGWDIDLKVLTNARALSFDGLHALKGLGLSYYTEEWTEEAEQAALRDAQLVILPVNAQSFSRAKSLNRAVSSLNFGCQILSVGFPLYRRLNEFIYRNSAELSKDLKHNTARLRPAAVPKLTRFYERHANSSQARMMLAKASAAAMKSPSPRMTKWGCLAHGRSSPVHVHKAASRAQLLSVKTPFCKARWNFPIRFDIIDSRLEMLIADRLVGKQISKSFLRGSVPVPQIGASGYLKLDSDNLLGRAIFFDSDVIEDELQCLVHYRRVMTYIKQSCCKVIGDRFVLSEKWRQAPATSGFGLGAL